MILNRRTAHRDTMLCLEQSRGASHLRGCVLNRLRLIQDDVVELRIFQLDNIASQRAVGCEDDVVLMKFVPQLRPFQPGILKNFELRRKLGRFLLPVKHQRLGNHDERRKVAAVFLLNAVLQQGEHLNRFAEAHVVGQAAAKAELLKELKPAEAFPLVASQFALEIFRLCRRFDSVKRPHAVAQGEELLVVVDGVLRDEQRVDQTGLRIHKTQMIALSSAKASQQPVLLEPLFRKNTERPVVQANRRFAA